MLTGRRNRLKFDDFISDWFNLDNGIVQGDPLSMILYLFYNADVLDIASRWNKMCLGYVDNMALVAEADCFADTHRVLGRMMLRSEGALSWSELHNSRFETTKSVLMDFSHAKNLDWPPMQIGGISITPQPMHKFLGVMMDQELQWRQHADYALAKAAKWTLAFRQLARPASGIKLQLMQQMYNAVAVPKITYVADMWYTPKHKKVGATKNSRSVGITNRLASVQRMATLAITGAMRTMATDTLDLHAGIWPMDLMLH